MDMNDPELKQKEIIQEMKTIIGEYMRQQMKVLPEDVGDGWRKLQMPPLPMYKYSSSYQKDCSDGGFFNLIIERRIGRDDTTVFPTGRWHLSISHNFATEVGMRNRPGRVPTWEEITEVRIKFLPKDVNMAIMFPPEEMYYNRHTTCIHLLEIPVSLALDAKKIGGI